MNFANLGDISFCGDEAYRAGYDSEGSLSDPDDIVKDYAAVLDDPAVGRRCRGDPAYADLMCAQLDYWEGIFYTFDYKLWYELEAFCSGELFACSNLFPHGSLGCRVAALGGVFASSSKEVASAAMSDEGTGLGISECDAHCEKSTKVTPPTPAAIEQSARAPSATT